VVSLPIFNTFIMMCILINTIFLSLERYPMPKSDEEIGNYANIVFTSIFTAEVVLKFIGLSPKKYFLDKFNIFDLIVVLISILDLTASSGSGGISTLRAFRLFRIFKLFRTGDLRVLLDSIAYTMSSILYYVILLALFIYVYSLLGMQFFAGQLHFNDEGHYDPDGKLPRANFDTFYWASITVFQVLIGDNWPDVMFNCEKSLGFLASFYFITLILFGNIVMLNLFLAILLGNFDKARTFWLKKKIFEMFEIAKGKKISLSKAIRIILGEVSDSVREELTIHEQKDIFMLNGRLGIINRKILQNEVDGDEKLDYYDEHAIYREDYQPHFDLTFDGIESASKGYDNENDDDEDFEDYDNPDEFLANSKSEGNAHNTDGALNQSEEEKEYHIATLPGAFYPEVPIVEERRASNEQKNLESEEEFNITVNKQLLK